MKKKREKKSDMTKYKRIILIFSYLIRKRPKKFTSKDIYNYLSNTEPVTLRNVQRDMLDIVNVPDSHVKSEKIRGVPHYFIEPDNRSKMTLPIKQNGLLALFLLKRIQPFFRTMSQEMKDVSQSLEELANDENFDLFDDLDSDLDSSTYIMGEKAGLSLKPEMYNDLITALVKKRKLKVMYNYQDGVKEKTLCPVRLVLWRQELYFLCISDYYKNVTFWVKLCRIESAGLLEETFEITTAQKKQINKRLSDSFGILDNENVSLYSVRLRFPKHFRQFLSEKSFHPSQKISSDSKGNTIITMRVPVDRDLVQWVLGWAENVTVIAPKVLRERLHDVGKALVTKYR